MKLWKRLLLWSLLGLVGLLLAAVAWLWTADLGVLKPQIERLVTGQTGRQFAVEGPLRIDIAGRTVVVANGLTFENASWASEPEMIRVERLEVQLDLWSLINGPVIVHLVDVDGARIFLERSADGQENWALEIPRAPEEEPEADDSGGFPVLFQTITIDDSRVRIESPERTGPIDIVADSIRQQYRDDDFLDLSVSGAIGDRAIRVDGELGDWQALLTGENIRYSLDGELDSFSIRSSGLIDSLSQPRRPSLTFAASGPDINDLLRLAGIEPGGQGDINLEGALTASGTEPLALDVKGNVGRLEIEATGRFSDLANLENADLDLKASGPDLSRILRLFDINSVGESPFMIDIDAERRGPRITVDHARMLFAGAEFEAAASIPNFPDLDDADVELSIAGPDIEQFREILNLPGVATGEFSLVTTLKSDADGVEIVDLEIITALGHAQANGRLGEEPRLVGTDVTFGLESGSLARLAASYGLPNLPDRPVNIRGAVLIEPDGVRIRGPSVVTINDITVSVDGMVHPADGFSGTSLGIEVSGPDLLELVNSFTDTEFVPARPYRLKGALDVAGSSIGIRNLAGDIGSSAVGVSGTLRMASRLEGTRFEFSANGPEIGDVLPAALNLEARPGPYALSGAIELRAGAIELSNVQLKRDLGVANLDLEIGTTEKNVRFAIDASGADVRTLLSRIKGIEADEAPFAVTARGDVKEKLLSMKSLDVKIGEARLDAKGSLDLASDAQDSRLQFSLDVPSLARLGKLGDHRMRDQALTVAGTVVSSGGVVTLDNTTAHLDNSDITGSVRFETGDIPRLEVKVSSDSLVLESPIEQSEAPYDPEPKFQDGRLIPDVPVPIEALRSVNASVNIAVGDLIRDKSHFRNVRLVADLEDGTLELSQLRFDAPSGRLDARAALVPVGNSANVELQLSADDLALGLVEANKELALTGDGRFNLSASGANLRELAASANGIILVDTRGGRFGNNRMLQMFYGDMLEEILSAINPFHSADSFTTYECIVFPLRITDGKLSSTPNAFVRTNKIAMVLGLNINLDSEALDISVRTTPRKGIIISAGELLNPYVKIVGTLAAPRLAVDEQGVLISGGAAVATGGLTILAKAAWDRLSRSKDPCGDTSKKAIEELGAQFPDLSVAGTGQ